jgi:hypothetical protein
VASGQHGSGQGRQSDGRAARGPQRREPAGWRRLAASLRERWRSELTPRGYLAYAGLFAVLALLSLWKLLSPGHDAFSAAFAIVSNVLWVGLLVAGFIARRRRGDGADPHSKS